MAIFHFECDDELFPIENVSALEGAFADVAEADCTLCFEFLFVDEDEIQRLNRETRNIDKVTDVLSYPSLDDIKGEKLCADDYPYELDEDGNLFMGSVVVCVARAKEQAEEYGHSLERELTYLICHGLLHLMGYDHMTEEDKKEMRLIEEEIMNGIKVYR